MDERKTKNQKTSHAVGMKHGAALLMCCLTLVAAASCTEYERRVQGTPAQRAIVEDVKDMVEDCRAMEGGRIAPVNRALVWNMRTNRPSPVSYNVYSAPAYKDKPVTVFMIVDERNERVGTYSSSKQPAYRRIVDIAAVLWPSRTPLGFHSIECEPSDWRVADNEPGYGDSDSELYKWINGLTWK